MNDELRDRFREHQPDEKEAEEEDDADSSDGPSTTHNAQTSDVSDGSGSPASSSGSHSSGGSGSSSSSVNVRDRPQMSMYLPPDVKERVENDYEKLDAKSKLADQGGLRKNDDFFVGMIQFALEEKRDEFEEYIGASEDE